MHELAFADAARPTPVAVLKLPLRVYTLGHELLLLRRRNPLRQLIRHDFEKLPLPQQHQALINAVLICCDTYTYRERLEQPSLFNWRVRWHNFKVRLWQSRLSAEEYALALADFRNYLEEGTRILPCLASDTAADAEAYEIANKGAKLEGGRAAGAPFLAQLINFALATNVLGNICPDRKTLWEIPFALVANLYVTALENEGRVYIENYREREEREAMIEHRAAVKREREEEEKNGKSEARSQNPEAGLATAPPNLESEDDHETIEPGTRNPEPGT